MADLMQLDQDGRPIHAHAYTITAGNPKDLTTDGRSFYVCKDNARIDVLTIRGQVTVEDNDSEPSGSPSINEYLGITYVGGAVLVIGYRSATQYWIAKVLTERPLVFNLPIFRTSLVEWRGMASLRSRVEFDRFVPRFDLSPDLAVAWVQTTVNPPSRISILELGNDSGGARRINTQLHNDNSMGTNWNSLGADVQCRGITHMGPYLWRLTQNAGRHVLQRYIPEGREWRLTGPDIDISATVGGTTRGLTNDGLYLYTVRT